MVGKRKTLTTRQKDFADAFIRTRNVYKAAVEAGYSETYAKTGTGANRLIDNPLVQKYIERRVSKMDARMVASQEEILYYLTRVFRREETEDVVNIVKVPTVVEYVDAKGDTKEKAAYRDEAVITQVRNSVPDATKAANDLLKIVGRTTQSKLEMAKLRKALAEAKLAERKANNDDTSDVTIQIVPWEDE